LILGTETDEVFAKSELTLFPNPVRSGEFIIKSTLLRTQFSIIDAYGHIVMKDVFKGNEKRFSFSYPPGLYFLRYKVSDNNHKIIKIIKL